MTERCNAHREKDAFSACYPELNGLPAVIGWRGSQQPIFQEDGKREFARLRDYVGRGPNQPLRHSENPPLHTGDCFFLSLEMG